MKSIIALVAVLALTGTVDAATKTKSARSAKAAKGTKVAAVKKNAAQPQAADVSAAASDVQSTETAKLSEVKPVVQAKAWSASLDSDTYSLMNGAKAGTENIDSYHAIKAGYKIADTTTVQAVYEWHQSWGAGADTNVASTTMIDPSLRITGSDLADLGMGIGLSGQVRVYLPVSEDSQDKGQITQIRLYGTASREITKALSASFTLNPRIYAQQNDTYNKADGTTANIDTFRLLSSAGVKYAINDMFAVEQTLGLYQMWKTNTTRADYLDASSSVYFTPVSWFDLNLGVRQGYAATDIRKAGGSDLYNDDVTEYYLVTSFSL